MEEYDSLLKYDYVLLTFQYFIQMRINKFNN